MSYESRDLFTGTTGDKPAGGERDRSRDIGHYFEQSVLCGHARLLAARAATLAMNEELSRLGVLVDFATGKVTVRRA